MKTFAIGVDLGATTIKVGAVNKHGKLLDQFAVETNADKGPTVVIQQITLAVTELFGRHRKTECMGIGIGAPGVVSVDDQVVKYPPNFSDWKEIALGKALRKNFPMPVFIENDANCAAIAEAKHGAGRDFKDFLFVIWGTGIGGGIIVNHKIYRGPQGAAGEIGHISIDYNGPDCNCGSRGCIESYIGQRYLTERTKNILKKSEASRRSSRILYHVDGNMGRLEPFYITKAAEEGDQTAIEILEEAGALLGYALASAINILDINVVIIGGGLSGVPQFVFDAVSDSVKSRVLKPHQSTIRIVRASLGNAAGIIGAASLVM